MGLLSLPYEACGNPLMACDIPCGTFSLLSIIHPCGSVMGSTKVLLPETKQQSRKRNDVIILSEMWRAVNSSRNSSLFPDCPSSWLGSHLGVASGTASFAC